MSSTEWLLFALVGAVGLSIGSFLNVVIARVPEGLSIVRPGSRCPNCGHVLRWYENIPLFSWLALRARCGGCKKPISARYPLVELLTAVLFLAALQQFGPTWMFVRAILLVGFLVPLTFIDLDTWTLPSVLTFPGIAVGILSAIPFGTQAVLHTSIGAAVAYFAFWGLEWLGEKIFKQEALGAGDKDLLALIGAFVGWQPLLGVVFLSSFQGAIVGLILRGVYGRAAGPLTPESSTTAKQDEDDDWVPGPSNLPFGPWLSLAALEVVFLGTWLGEHLPAPLGLLVGA